MSPYRMIEAAGTEPIIGALLRQAESLLGASDSARLDAEVLLGQVLGLTRAALIAGADTPVALAARGRYLALVAERARGVPIAYLVGRREFWSMVLVVDEHTLVPRPETEHLVEAALRLMVAHGLRLVLDLGTGSGAVALAIGRESPGSRVTATDLSRGALAVAKGNALRLGLRDIRLLEGDWYGPLAGQRFDLIVSNPPYVADRDLAALAHEPRLALAGGEDGLTALRVVITGAPQHLDPGGWLVLEHGADQGAAVRGLMAEAGLQDRETIRDYAGHERVSLGRGP